MFAVVDEGSELLASQCELLTIVVSHCVLLIVEIEGDVVHTEEVVGANERAQITTLPVSRSVWYSSWVIL